ncbi:hypothetical protein BDF20DRAFT_840310 [Mycotypha africana]|uniref:uncharacterized protein n=1 Tax=Mycotypha africana TaxID=64632 RepID=UPI0022FFFF03|nr:uncharacterized protein BDF20DRAFT_840310 [Mycotypha africana]KAI8967225.1 hypothetical protein BDF20DRAFT_840310 [Mycotypha africana]
MEMGTSMKISAERSTKYRAYSFAIKELFFPLPNARLESYSKAGVQWLWNHCVLFSFAYNHAINHSFAVARATEKASEAASKRRNRQNQAILSHLSNQDTTATCVQYMKTKYQRLMDKMQSLVFKFLICCLRMAVLLTNDFFHSRDNKLKLVDSLNFKPIFLGCVGDVPELRNKSLVNLDCSFGSGTHSTRSHNSD